MEQVFNVKSEIYISDFKRYEEMAKKNQTKHFIERNERIKAYDEANLLDIDFLYGFIVDTNHPNGDEMHFINPNGVIYIMNYNTGRLITVLGARPGQIRRYFTALDMEIDQDLVDVAYNNFIKGYNNL